MTEPAEIDIRIVRGAPTDEEVAALTAVLTQAIADGAAEDDSSEDAPLQTPWQRSQRALRKPLIVGPGRWRGFDA
ncbi:MULTISPECIES: acyl-CoA carboxylase subunit epsilon [unclassified Plantibacter]|uniref:acyl-CoA carboxylase subunit epsilon n=1 Tax=unclassified Plantibacter TaxID=2624265 RepID=UPI003D357EE4